MAGEGYLLMITATIAVVALVVAVIAMRRLRAYEQATNDTAEAAITESLMVMEPAPIVVHQPEIRIVDGRVIVAPTNQQVVMATMSKPLVRIAIITAGFHHAFRPEARDRIRRLMRNEYRTRKAMRRKAAREAAWHHDQANSSTSVVSGESWS